jgi:predicted DNA-binding ribbon-helix-helix protein
MQPNQPPIKRQCSDYHVEYIDLPTPPDSRRLDIQQHCEAAPPGISFRKTKFRREGTMCHLFAHQPQRDYESQTRSLRINGHSTSIRLEMSFWDTLEEIAAKEGMSLAKFLTTLHNEVLDHHGEVKNFASLLRCSCLIYRSKQVSVVPEFAAKSTRVFDAAE